MSHTTSEQIRWCAVHDEPARRLAGHCVLGLRLHPDPPDCEVKHVGEVENRCLGGCGRHTLARFEDGTHGPGPYCGWCVAVPA